jgi:hypothetical protein
MHHLNTTPRNEGTSAGWIKVNETHYDNTNSRKEAEDGIEQYT